jgi:hypothetical protein
MTHLVKKHDTGEYCLSEDDPSSITKKCSCGDSDVIILSWEEGKRKETIESYFSKVKKNGQSVIDTARENEDTSYEMASIVRILYSEDRNLITNLFEQKIISKGELRRLIKLNRQAEIKQLEIVRDSFKYHAIVTVGSKNKLLLKKAKK